MTATRSLQAALLVVLAPSLAGAAPLPDLAVSDVQTDSVAVTPLGSFNVSWTAHNLGDAQAMAATWWIVLSVNDVITPADIMVANGQLEFVNPNSQIDQVNTVSLPVGIAPGLYHVGVLLDPQGVIPESDELNNAAAAPDLVAIGSNSVVVVTSILPPAVVGAPYCVALLASGGDGKYVWSADPGQLPPGLVLQEEPPQPRTVDRYSTLLCGIPAGAGRFQFPVSVQSAGLQAQGTLALNVDAAPEPLVVVTAYLPEAWPGAAYEADLHAVGGTPPYSWSADGDLPANLSLSSGGTLQGSTVVEGTHSFTVTVKDAAGLTASGTATLLVEPPWAVACPAQQKLDALVGQPFTAQLQADGGTGPYTWRSLSTWRIGDAVDPDPGVLPVSPPGLTLAASGAVAGTPSLPGSYVWSVGVQDSDLQHNPGVCLLPVTVGGEVSLAVTSGSLPDACVGIKYSAQLQATGGHGDLFWSLAEGSRLPSGALLSSSGEITASGDQRGLYLNGDTIHDYVFTVRVRDADGQTAIGAIGLRVMQCPQVVPQTPKSGGCESAGEGGCLAAFAVLGALVLRRRAGVLLIATVLLPSAARAKLPDLQPVLLEGPATAGAGEVLTVHRVVQNIGAGPGAAAVRYVVSADATISADDVVLPAVTPRDVSADPGASDDGSEVLRLPSSLSAGVYLLGIIVDPDGSLDELSKANNELLASLPVMVRPADLQVATTRLTAASVGLSYQRQLVAIGGGGDYLWSATDPALPDWLSLTPDGLLTGTAPPAPGMFTFGVRVMSGGVVADARLDLVVAQRSGPLTLATDVLWDATIALPYRHPLDAWGGTPPYVFSSQGLPPGLAISGDYVEGTPGQEGCVVFTATVTDAWGQSDARPLSLCVLALGELSFSTVLEDAQVGQPYQQAINVVGGVAPFAFAIDGLDGTGITENGAMLSGTPTIAGVFSVYLQVTTRGAPRPASSPCW